MKNNLLKLLSLGLVLCLGLCLSGCGKDKKKKRRSSGDSGAAVENVIAPVQAPAMEDYRELAEEMEGVILEVVSGVPGKLEVLTEQDELMGASSGKKPRVRCVVPAGQPLYKINFEPADQSMGTQRVFLTETSQKKSYIQISSDRGGKDIWVFKRQQKPF